MARVTRSGAFMGGGAAMVGVADRDVSAAMRSAGISAAPDRLGQREITIGPLALRGSGLAQNEGRLTSADPEFDKSKAHFRPHPSNSTGFGDGAPKT